MEPTEIVERVWPGRVATIEPLGGGITNRNFRVEVGNEAFVLRIGGKDTQLLGIDRESEYAASRVAAELGLAPEVVAFLEPEGYLVTRFVAGEVGKVDIAQAGAALQRLHDGPAIPSSFDSFPCGRGLPPRLPTRVASISHRSTDSRAQLRVGSRSIGAVRRSVPATTTC